MTFAEGDGFGAAVNRGARSIRAGTGKGTGGEPSWVRGNGTGHGLGYRCGTIGDEYSGAGNAPGSSEAGDWWEQNG